MLYSEKQSTAMLESLDLFFACAGYLLRVLPRPTPIATFGSATSQCVSIVAKSCCSCIPVARAAASFMHSIHSFSSSRKLIAFHAALNVGCTTRSIVVICAYDVHPFIWWCWVASWDNTFLLLWMSVVDTLVMVQIFRHNLWSSVQNLTKKWRIVDVLWISQTFVVACWIQVTHLMG